MLLGGEKYGGALFNGTKRKTHTTDTAVDPRKLLKAKKTYYRMMGWDEKTGVPTVGKLEELDIPWVAELLITV